MTRFRSITILALAIGVCIWLAARWHASQIAQGRLAAGESILGANPGKTGTGTMVAASESSAIGRVQWKDVKWAAVAEIMSGKATGRTLLTNAQVEAFLHKHGASAINLLAAWESTRESKWLERALAEFPNDPAVLLALLGDSRTDENRAALVARFKQVAPDNPLPWIFSAEQLFKVGRNTDAIAELRQSLEKPGFYVYGNEVIGASQQLYRDAGLDPIGGEFLAIAQLPLDHLSAAMRVTRALQNLAKEPSTSPDIRREIAELSYGMGEMFSTPEASRTAIGQLVGITIESHALKLAQSEEKNPLSVDPTARLAELDRKKSEIADFTELPQKMVQMQDAALLAGYMQRLRREGERNAIQWFKTQTR